MGQKKDELLVPLDVVDDRHFTNFSVVEIDYVEGFQYQVLAYDVNDDPMPLPPGIKQFYKTKEAANATLTCLYMLAYQKTVIEVKTWHKEHMPTLL
jgi:hypothetical protein